MHKALYERTENHKGELQNLMQTHPVIPMADGLLNSTLIMQYALWDCERNDHCSISSPYRREVLHPHYTAEHHTFKSIWDRKIRFQIKKF
jgi:hypothetical protein